MNKTIVPDLLFHLLAISKGEIGRYEKLYTIHKTLELGTPNELNELHLADLYLECCVFSEAEKIFAKRQAFRKLGDLAWAVGHYDDARRLYSHRSEQHRPDWDRLLRLAFLQGNWPEVLTLFRTMDAFPINVAAQFEGQFVLGVFSVPIAPIRDMVLFALLRQAKPLDDDTKRRFEETMGLRHDDLTNRYAALAMYPEKDMQAFIKKMRPRFVDSEPKSLDHALTLGETPRSAQLIRYIRSADEAVICAKESLVEFLTFGQQAALDNFLLQVTGSGIKSITESMLFYTVGYELHLKWDKYSTKNLLSLLSSHPCMDKQYFGRLLDYKFKAGMLPNGHDLVTGMFQIMATSNDFDKKYVLDQHRLASASDWAVVRCEEWADTEGRLLLEQLCNKWLKHRCKAAQTLYTDGTAVPQEPRETVEWHSAVATCQNWLALKWKEEIENFQWKSEQQLFLLLKKALKGHSTVQHASPTWLAPQHYDIFIPELETAIEYMGQQHYQPIDRFGGEAGFLSTMDRDTKKQRVSESCGVTIYYVRYDENLGEAVKRIITEIDKRKKNLNAS